MTRTPNLLHEFFDLSWRRWPNTVAIDVPPLASGSRRVQCTYAELAQLSETITERLTPKIAGECLVALLLPRSSVLAYAAQLGVLRAGAGYVPVDPALPDGRVADILADARPVLVLTNDEGAERAARLGIASARVMVLDGDARSAYAEESSPYRSAPPLPDALAYVIYTSGTTGKPKGVMVTHRAIANLVASDIDEFKLAPGDRAAQTSSHGYDSSIEESWLALASGATLVVVDDEIVRLGPDLIPWLERERLTVLCPSPTLLRSMGYREARGTLPRLKLVYVGGERMPQDVTDAWAPGRRLVNGYGPTECAVTALRGDLSANEPVTIGRAIPGVDAWILDDELNEVPDGESGELYLGGVGLARGYWNAPELTARAFPTHPRLGRIYRTGDLAHRLPDGRVVCAGRLDAQVKIRGHRVELEEIDTHLTRCAGVQAAACALSTRSVMPVLIAAVVPLDASAPPSAESLRTALRRALPAHMVPSRFRFVSALPVASSGKLDRVALAAMDADSGNEPPSPDVQSGDAMEAMLAAKARAAFHAPGLISLDAHFFDDIGADSLAAAEFVTLLRDEPTTALVTVRDIYEAPTVRALAARLSARQSTRAPNVGFRRSAPVRGGRPTGVTIVQALWLGVSFAVGAALSSAFALELLPRMAQSLGLIPFLLLTPVAAVAAFVAYAAGATALAVFTKRRLIGRYTARRDPVWSNFYLRHWLVIRSAHAIPWWLIEGTELQSIVLRALGARIGKRVHLHRGVNLRDGGWDLLTIGDDVTVSQEASLQLVDFEDGQIIIGSITLEDDVTLDVRAGVGSGACIERGGCLTPHSVLRAGARIPASECWDGIPAQRVSAAPPRPVVTRITRDLSPLGFAAWVMFARLGAGALIAFPYVIVAMLLALAHGHDSARFLNWLANPRWTITAVLAIVVPLPIGLALTAIAARALGTVTPGVIGGWSAEYVRVLTKTSLVDLASRWLAGTLVWPVWLRASGMHVGAGAEISTILDVVPELLTIGPGSFLTDGIYPGGPRVDRGTVTLARTRIGTQDFIGNHAVIPCGQHVADHVLLGVCTVVDDRQIREGSAWFGHPPFALARKAPSEDDLRMGRRPTRIAYLTRVFWEWMRFVIPVPPVVIGVLWFSTMDGATNSWSPPMVYGVVAPLVTFAAAALLCVLVIAIKWGLLGRVKPGRHAFWSCWCGRWDFVYVAWEQLARPLLFGLEGTLLLAWYLRAMGARIGRRVVLGHEFAQLVDPDMLWIGDDATVCGTFQAHTFEDRLLKIDRIRVEPEATVTSGSLLFYDTIVGARAFVAPHSVVMKGEHLAAEHIYEGCPVRQVS